MTQVVLFPREVQTFSLMLRTGKALHGPYVIDADVLDEGEVGDFMVFWNDRGTCIHGKIETLRPLK